MNFQIHALNPAEFEPLFNLETAELAKRNARLEVVKNNPGYPCRVSLADAEVGETVLLTNYEHQSADSPYRARYAIYVRQNVAQAKPAVNEIPEVLSTRQLSVRGFDHTDMLRQAEVAEGRDIASCIKRIFEDDTIAYIHLHNAGPGCFAARVTRSDGD